MMKNISVLKSFSEPVLMLLYKSQVLNSEKLNSLMRKKGHKYLDIEKKVVEDRKEKYTSNNIQDKVMIIPLIQYCIMKKAIKAKKDIFE